MADPHPHTRLLQEDLLARIEARLAVVPTSAELHLERAHLLSDLQRPKDAALAYLQAIASTTPKYPLTSRAYSIRPYHGKMLPITVLLLVSPASDSALLRRYLDDQTFLVLQVIPDFHEPGLVLPPHQLVINGIGDADSCQASLKAAMALLAQTTAPIINSPAQVLLTERESNARRLASIPGVTTPSTAAFPIRKYRVMAIDGKFHPVHAISSTATADSPEHRDADQAFLENMPSVLGERAMETLVRIQDAMKLDCWGIDFSLGADGEILLFEAGPSLNVPPPEQGEAVAYRKAPLQRIADAIRIMLFDRAKELYLGILLKDPAQIASVNNLGAVLNIMGHHKAALKVYRDLVAQNPDSAKAHMTLAHSLRESCELEEARRHYETALRLAPDFAEAHLGLAYVLMYLREPASAWEHHKKAAGNHPATTFPYREEKDLPRIIVLASPCGGNSPIVRFLDKKTFQTLIIVPDFYDSSAPLPPHELIISAIGDADHCGTSLEAAERLLQQQPEPVLNFPARVQTTGRADNAHLLGTLEGVVTPRIATLSRDILAGAESATVLEQHGLAFPLLLRVPGFHGGDHFLRVERPDDLAQAVSTLPGQKLMAIQYLDARDDDGKIRKYRVMMIGGKLYPLHKAVSRGWMIHYFSAEMTQSPEHRAEDEAFLNDMPGVLGSPALKALERIRDALGLDYAGADFSLGRNGEILLFEANATMAVPVPDKEAQWDYRRPPVQRIQDAVRDMILARAR
jgi:tetratricopeptide (TPR) repeat protein